MLPCAPARCPMQLASLVELDLESNCMSYACVPLLMELMRSLPALRLMRLGCNELVLTPEGERLRGMAGGQSGLVVDLFLPPPVPGVRDSKSNQAAVTA